MGRLFGTDGVRGIANRDLTADLAMQLARAAARATDGEAGPRTVLIGRDTRVSGDMLEAALVAGFTSMGVTVWQAGVLPTPAIAFLTRVNPVGLGVVISASHNPYEDNGIKFFAADGTKLSATQEEAIEAEMPAAATASPAGRAVGRTQPFTSGGEQYLEFLRDCCPAGLKSLRVVGDFANGAAYAMGPRALADLRVDLTALNVEPDGTNINAGCGSLHPEVICRATVEAGADVGLTFDGDADRCLLSDERGHLVDGDQILGMFATTHDDQSTTRDAVVVGTVMSNLGLERALAAHGIRLERTPVGDRCVWERMVECAARFGGEPSGHVILRDYATTGDGLLTAVRVLHLMKTVGQPLSDLARCVEKVPQVTLSVRVREPSGWEGNAEIASAIQEARAALDGSGRVVVRASGTEPKMRIMIEGEDRDTIEGLARHLGAVVREQLGGV